MSRVPRLDEGLSKHDQALVNNEAMAFTYILKCADGSYYTGVTNNIQRRLWEHNTGAEPSYTLNRRPVSLVWCSDDVDIAMAIQTEKQIKGWRRVKKEALIRGEIDSLIDLSKAYRDLK